MTQYQSLNTALASPSPWDAIPPSPACPLSEKLTSIKTSLTEAAHSHVFFHLTPVALEQNFQRPSISH